MKKSVKWIAGIGMALIIAGICIAEPLKGAITGSFVGTDGAYTNTTGMQVQLTAVILTGTMSASTDSWVKVESGSDTWILAAAGVTNTLAWYSGSGGFNLQKDGIVTFYSACGAAVTNRYRIEGR